VRNILEEKLDGDETVEAGVLCFVYDTHPAASQLSKDGVMENILANHQWHAQGNTIFRTFGWVEGKVSVFSVYAREPTRPTA